MCPYKIVNTHFRITQIFVKRKVLKRPLQDPVTLANFTQLFGEKIRDFIHLQIPIDILIITAV